MSLEELKNKIKDVAISSIISQYIALDKKGANLVGLCPFHSDTKPSLMVNDNKGIFKCFACDTGGDGITFVQKYKRVEFIDALKEIANLLNLPFEDFAKPKKESPEVTIALKVLSRAAKIYKKHASTSQYPAFNEFVKNRGMSEETVQSFSLGFAPGNNPISGYLGSIKNADDRKSALEIAEKIKLIKKDKYREGQFYDSFRERIIFPIWNGAGKPVGFGSRATNDDQQKFGKYINSAESFIFNKKNVLYGEHLAKSYIREKNSVILVEGYMDLIALHQHGFKNSVAVMGTAMSEHSVRNLKNLTQNFYLGLDSDAAGFEAMRRINQICLENGITPRYLSFAPEKDPDEFLQKCGPLELQKRIDTAIPFIDIMLAKLIPDEMPEVLDRKLEILTQAFEIIDPLQNELSASERVISFAKRLNLKSSPEQITKNFADFKTNKQAKKRPAIKVVSQSLQEVKAEEPVAAPISESKVSAPITKAEKKLINELVQHPECLTHSEITELLDFVDNFDVQRYVKRLREIVYEADENEYPSLVSNLVHSEDYSIEIKEITGAALFNYQASVLNEKVIQHLLKDLVLMFKKEQLKRKRQELKKRKEQCTTKEQEEALLVQLVQLEKDLSELKKQKK